VSGTVIVGGSVGGVRTAQWLRKRGYAGSITLVEREPHPPYDKPPLSKAVLSGPVPTLPALLSEPAAEALGISLALGTEAVGLDAGRRIVHLADGGKLPYDDALVIATGARARPSPWTEVPGVLPLRGWHDALRIRRGLDTAERLVVIGAGFIGAEVASAARERGLTVDVVDVAPVPMARLFGNEVGGLFARLHEQHGVTTHFGLGVSEVRREGRSLVVVLDDGQSLQADLVVVGLGTELNTEWLRDSGLQLEDGVVCDSTCRAVGAADVYVVGDAARWWHHSYGELTRTEHWTNAVEQAMVVAHNIVHPDSPRDHVPVNYVWSDQYGWKIQIAGRPWVGVRTAILRVDQDSFTVVWADAADLLCGVVTVNQPRVGVRARQLLATRCTMEDARGSLWRATTAGSRNGASPHTRARSTRWARSTGSRTQK
jgi:phthalate 3,4-dioxygenase ferredoxin reductase subunit